MKYPNYGLWVMQDGSAFYITDEKEEVIAEFPKGQPSEVNGLMMYPTNEEVWIRLGNLMEEMDKAMGQLLKD